MNLASLGITISDPEAFTNAILSETGLTREEAVAALAEKLGVETQPAERVVALDDNAQRVLREAGSLLNGIFSAS